MVQSRKDGWVLAELSMVVVVSLLFALLSYRIAEQLVPSDCLPLIAISSHIPIFFIPWLWLKARTCNVNWYWTKGSSSLLMRIVSWLLPLIVLLNMDVVFAPPPHWYVSGIGSVILQMLFQGLFVGMSEEMLMRPTIQRTLMGILPQGSRVPVWVTAVAFGLFHLTNIGHQSAVTVLLTVIYTFLVGLLIGYYYARTQNYWGTVILHSVIDLPKVLLVIMAANIA